MDVSTSSTSGSGSSQGRGFRGTSWTRSETKALLHVWGEAELKHAVSSLRRNYEIFEEISANLRKMNVHRSAKECRTKTKLLRRDYKRAIAHNSRSGGGPSNFQWKFEMDRIFRGDPSMEPLRVTETDPGTAMVSETNAQDDAVFTLELYDENADWTIGGTEEPEEAGEGTVEQGANNSSEDAAPALETEGVQSPIHQPAPVVSCNPEANLDPATRMALMRRRRQRTSPNAGLSRAAREYVQWCRSANSSTLAAISGRMDEMKEIFKRAVDIMDNCYVAMSGGGESSGSSGHCSSNRQPCSITAVVDASTDAHRSCQQSAPNTSTPVMQKRLFNTPEATGAESGSDTGDEMCDSQSLLMSGVENHDSNTPLEETGILPMVEESATLPNNTTSTVTARARLRVRNRGAREAIFASSTLPEDPRQSVSDLQAAQKKRLVGHVTPVKRVRKPRLIFTP